MLNDLRNFTNNDMPDKGLILWIVFILLIPLFFNVGPMALILWWILLLWGYLIPSEKWIAYFFVFLILMSSWIAHVGAGFITYTKNQLNTQIFISEHKLGNDLDAAAISSWIVNHPADAEPMNTMALIEINRSDFPEAIKLLNRCIDLEPDNPRFYNHLGLALLGTGKVKESFKAFQNAISLMPDNMLYYYNVSRLYQSSYNFYEGEKAIAAASGLDADGVRRLLDAENAVGRTRYIQEYTPLMRYMARQMKPSDDIRIVADSLWTFTFGVIPRKASIFLAVGCFLLFITLGYIPDDKFTKRCSRCGKLYYSGAMTKTGNPMCLQCHWIDVKAKKQQGNILHHKTEEIRKYKTFSYQKLVRLELMLPGLGSFLTNRTGIALGRIIVLSASLIAIITGGQFIISFIPVDANFTNIMRAIGIISLCALWMKAYKTPPIRYGVQQ
ncbi:MAG TPA: tetratricopeptide repeat protein [Desulfomonilia bacterium]|nr:tetratricopeptide repeat protein [Desulfomonilia bacterium]